MTHLLELVKNSFTQRVTDTSPVAELNKIDLAKLIKTTILISISAGITYFISNISPDLLGPYQPLIMVALTFGLDFFNKLLKNNTQV